MTTPQKSPAGELYVHRIDELREEIRHAMAAISGNRLQAFEESLWRQEVLCTRLKHLLGTAQDLEQTSAVSDRLQASMVALHRLNQSYAELLKQAQASNLLLYSVCQRFEAHSHDQSGPAMPRYSLEA